MHIIPMVYVYHYLLQRVIRDGIIVLVVRSHEVSDE